MVQKTTKAEPSGDVRRICMNCHHYCPVKPMPGHEGFWGTEVFAFGDCRCMPPTALNDNIIEQAPNQPTVKIRIKVSRYPHVSQDDWCGQWALRKGDVNYIIGQPVQQTGSR